MGKSVNDAALRDEIDKRFTLNWLIQGAAQHAGMTFHHLVRGELDAINPELVALYDQYALINLLQYWHFDGIVLLGWPPRFWRRAGTNPRHPFFSHPVLSRHGGMLAMASRERAIERCKEKGFRGLRFWFTAEVLKVVSRMGEKEKGHEQGLIRLAKHATSDVWGIPAERLEAEITTKVAFGKLSWPRTFRGWVMRSCAVGYGGVLQRGDSLVVVGRGTNWYLMAKELVKGTAELICLHGLNRLPDAIYRQVIRAADGPHFEPWMLQTGGELWRRLLAVLPDRRPIAEILMQLARLPGRSLQTLILAIIEQPDLARELLAGLGLSDAETMAYS